MVRVAGLCVRPMGLVLVAVLCAAFAGCGGGGGLDVTPNVPDDGADGGNGGTTVTPSVVITRSASGPFELPNAGGAVSVTATVTAATTATVSNVVATFTLDGNVEETLNLAVSATNAFVFTGQVSLPRNTSMTATQQYEVVVTATVDGTAVTSGAYYVTVLPPTGPPDPPSDAEM